MIRRSVGSVAAMCYMLGLQYVAIAGGPLSWDDNGNDPSKEWSVFNNWNPNSSPSGHQIMIGDLANAFGDTTLVDQDFFVNSLTVTNGADVDTSGNRLRVGGDTLVSGSGSSIFVDWRNIDDKVGLSLMGIDLISGAMLSLLGQVGSTDGGIVELESGVFNINGATSAGGHGTIQLRESTTGNILQNSGTLFVSGRPGLFASQRLPGMLTITNTGNGPIDLDGNTDDGVVDVDDSGGVVNDTSLTLVIDAPFGDSFSGRMDIGNGDTVDIENWQLNAGGANPAILNFNGNDTHTLRGGILTVSGATTQVNANGGTTVFENDLTFQDGQFTLANGATVQFDGLTSFPDATDFTNGDGTRIVINSIVFIGDSTVNPGEDFDWDSSGAGVNETVVDAGGSLIIIAENINVGAGNDFYTDTLTLNSGNLNVDVADGSWVMEGVLNLNNLGNDTPELVGDAFQIGTNTAFDDNKVNVGGTGLSRITAPVSFLADADVVINAGAILQTGNVTFFTVSELPSGTDNAEFTGAGTWLLAGTNTVSEAATINMTGGIVDLDNSSVAATTANDTFVNAPLTINVATMENYGSSKTTGMSITTSTLTIEHRLTSTGILTVNLDDPNAEWNINSLGVVNLLNDSTPATLLAGADVNLFGTIVTTGSVRVDVRLDIHGTVSILGGGGASVLQLSGGDSSNDPNTIVGGTIIASAGSILAADSGSSLHGFGEIQADIDFDGTAELRADDGTLTVNGAVLDASVVGTFDDDGILNVTNPWNSSSVFFVQLLGGELRGGTITNNAPSGILGQGLVSAPVINNTAIFASINSFTLRVETAANNNDWDGTTNTGQLNAINSGTLEIRDNAQFEFLGRVSATTNGTVFANGFELRFNSGSTLNLDAGTYRSTQTTFIGGTVSVGAGGGTLRNDQALGFVFVSGSNATLTGDLRLESGTTVNTGVTFAGGGSLVNVALLRLVDNANVGVRIENQGDLEIGGMNTANIGQVTAGNFEQTANGELIIHLGGIAAGTFDMLDIGGTAQLDGALRLFLQGGYVPVLGQGIEILQADLGVTGTFDSVIQPATMPAGLAFGLNYNPKSVVLKVIAAPVGLLGDYNDDGIVDAADYVVWRKNLGGGMSLPNDDTPGVGPDDYARWRTNFDRTAAAGSASARSVVPEPSLLVYLSGLLAIIAMQWRHRPLRA